MKASVHHWRFEDGSTSPNPGNPFPLDPPPRGWYCWVYPEDDSAFEEWMTRTCPTTDICHRFNSGNPMWTVYIKDDVEATVFQLMWLNARDT
jgi:hypothetical protein